MTSVGASPVLFPVGTTGYSPVWITNSGVVDTLGVNVVRDNDAAAFGGRVRTKWTISENNPGGGDYTLRFGWASALEDAAFRTDRANNAIIFNLSDTTEAGTGSYTSQFVEKPNSVSRAGITRLGPFAVGRFKDVTGVSTSPESGPQEFVLRQNYPNPFNATTTIEFTLAQASKVKVVVYDVLGKEITTLLNGRLDAGTHTVQWEANSHASGIYIYKIITKNSVQARKMVLVK